MTNNQIFPPILEGTIPAFTSFNKQAIIKIPFKPNRGNTSTINFTAKILVKTVNTNQLITTVSIPKEQIFKDFIECYLDSAILQPGSYYKFQVAFVEDNNVGYYSTPAIGKYLGEIDSDTVPNTTLTGTFRTEGPVEDPTIYTNRSFFSINFDGKKSGEFLYTSRVRLTNWNKSKTYYDSYEKIYDSSKTDDRGISHEDFYLKYELMPNIQYKLIISTTTGNLYQVEQEFYIMKEITKPPMLKADLVATYNTENSFIDITLHSEELEASSAEIVLLKSCSDTNFSEWEPIKTIKINNYLFTDLMIYKDFFIDYGKIYIYAFQQVGYDSTGKITYSSKKASQTIQTYFEHMYLTDGKKQLKIKFNPKVSSFKYNVLENKVNTIGGKYPFIFRNNQVRHAEFPVSGLVSYLSDELQLFLQYNNDLQSIQLDDDNFSKEKIFREECLKWLTDGKVKYFKAPAEGSFLVRLLNVGLTPNDTVSRMLFSFNSTAVEIGEINYDNLVKFNLFSPDKESSYKVAQLTGRTFTVSAENVDNAMTTSTIGPIDNPKSCKLNNFPGGSIITFTRQETKEQQTSTIQYIVKNSSYVNYDLNDFGPGIYSINCSVPGNPTPLPTIDLVYETTVIKNNNKNYIAIDYKNVAIKSFDGIDCETKNIFNKVNFPNYCFSYFLNFTKRQPLAYQGSPKQNQNLKGIYFHDGKYYVSEDGVSEKYIANPYTLQINGSIIDISHTNEFCTEVLEDVQEIILGYGVKLECGYSVVHEEQEEK